MRYLTIILLTLTSCELFNPTEYKVQEELKPYVNSFYKEGRERGYELPNDNLVIILQKGLRESCKCFGHTTWEEGGWTANPQVRTSIDYDYFYKVDSAQIAFTVFHELGHGVLRRKAHTNKVTIMNPDMHYRKTDYDLISELYRNNEIR